jgi:ADP-ribose pyrophosphatase
LYPARLLGDAMGAIPKVRATRRVRDAWPPISEDDVELPSGARRSWVRLHFGMSAAVLPLTSKDEIVLTREYRHGLGRIAYSLPGGTARDGESPEACARRELLEETGYAAPKLLPLHEGNNLTAYLEGTLHLFFAPGCTPTDRVPDPDEIAAVERLSVLSAVDRARRGEFESTVVSLAILLADARGWLSR